jgi:hypothetical protein
VFAHGAAAPTDTAKQNPDGRFSSGGVLVVSDATSADRIFSEKLIEDIEYLPDDSEESCFMAIA